MLTKRDQYIKFTLLFILFLYNKALRLYIYVVYMLAIADQSAAPNGLKIVEGTHGYPGVTFELKNKFFFAKFERFSSKIRAFFQNSNVFFEN